MQFTRENLKTDNEHSIADDLKNSSGIYRIILSNVSKIDRLIGQDFSAILYIGHAKRTNSLCKRIRDFYDSASNTNEYGNPPTTHKAGRDYQLYLKEKLGNAVENLKFEYVITDSDQEATRLEYNELKSYLDQYGELPPLNKQLPTISNK
ncbi:hypothetical protein ETN89_12975 [Photobacterium damselae subsp. damselae]|uniref:hypothetical protein n=1 Tax=Photobacterium damselae TaxID=38293 RepID=UPI000A2FA3B9|nr:hypothetical protein [Photobacterium damselae]ARR49310.1 hypothetical protein CAY62_06800 [Photobacterium damselae subsp. damselae]QAY36141.1 hypothetical protein ETN89_12975 [Photobacterium damselae subsp. damselae]